MKNYYVEELFSDIPGDPANVLLTFPPEIIEQVGWIEGDTIHFEVRDNQLIIKKNDCLRL